jgi:hypothetical protein
LGKFSGFSTKNFNFGFLEPYLTRICLLQVKTDLGTSAADITADVSIKGMLEVIEKLTPEDDVLLRNYDGAILPW